MRKVTLYLLPQGNALHTSPDFYKFIQSTYKKELELPSELIQKGVILKFGDGEDSYHVFIQEIHYQVNTAKTELLCSYCNNDFHKMGVFGKKEFFDAFQSRLVADRWEASDDN
ncbi:conserved hypothetical protein [Vibrio crassostreae]|uniref:hypothetical protein n=1 Tax=Vibrio crassostreae TaxID=246167 RepID=UPI0010479844|nr:hypothetical protein [Vibrio crassostreae]TCT98885.1 hypothetical protein EDB47_12859 [Vibrio crassostreae]CAK2324761.1 conserved hypothetical protein [Vibrio crassostreae]CAK2970203.1 conserved hypothetical protein [Vibrio crassostreae]CAK3004568.1 conserved hypothetical protein [Vibrio crassostreae]CAK3713571.1 conserved hypothetical protein [Vibrio crassostreae]